MTEENNSGGVFVVIEVQAVYDSSAVQAYQLAAREQVARRGGKVLGRGGTLFEGEPGAVSVMIQWWTSAQAFLDWQQSEEYLPLKKQREQAMKVRISIIPALE